MKKQILMSLQNRTWYVSVLGPERKSLENLFGGSATLPTPYTDLASFEKVKANIEDNWPGYEFINMGAR